MLISTETSSGKNYGNYFERITAIKNAGFDAFDLTIFPHKVFSLPEAFFLRKKTITQIIAETPEDPERVMTIEKAKEIRKFADKLGIPCNQTHAPFPTAWPNDTVYNEFITEYLITSIEISGILGAKICVVHPCNDYSPEQNAEMYNSLADTARKCGVKIALENMWNWNYQTDEAAPAACSDEENFARHLELLDKDVFVACVDLGHAEMRGLNTNAVKMIERLGDRVQALHIHDNDLHYDNHTLPFSSKIDFIPIMKALAKIGYTGDVTFETGDFLMQLPKELYESGLKMLVDTGRFFRDIIENKTDY